MYAIRSYYEWEWWQDGDEVIYDKKTWIIGSLDSGEWIEKKDGVYKFSNTLDNIIKEGNEFTAGSLYNLVSNYFSTDMTSKGFEISTSDKTAEELGKVYTYKSQSQNYIQDAASKNESILSALWTLNKIVFEKFSYDMSTDLKNISDSQLKDLSEMYYYFLNPDENNGVHYKNFEIIDKSVGIGASNTYFGSDKGEVLQGYQGDDHLYGT